MTTSNRRAEELELLSPFAKSCRLEFMKYRIIVDLEASDILTGRSSMAYHYYTIGQYSKAANEYKTFLGCRSYWTDLTKRGENLVIIQFHINAVLSCFGAQMTLRELYDATSGTAIGWGHSLFNELASLHATIKILREPKNGGLERGPISVQRRSQVMNCNRNHKAAVQLLSKSLGSLPTKVINPDETLKDLPVELHLSLAKGYISLGQPTSALTTLEQVLNSKTNLSMAWSHKLFKRMAKLRWGLKKRIT
ncbi:hypothetical protein PSHT_00450, partial [Puccinia striiformis]